VLFAGKDISLDALAYLVINLKVLNVKNANLVGLLLVEEEINVQNVAINN